MALDVVTRIARSTLVVLAGLTVGAVLWRPTEPRLALGVVGGGLLIGVSFWAIRGAVEGLAEAAKSGEIRRKSRGLALVKFFTRHAILAVAAYVMMARLRVDPIGILIGVSAPGIAMALDAFGVARRSAGRSRN